MTQNDDWADRTEQAVLDAAVARGDLSQARLESFRRMIDAGQ